MWLVGLVLLGLLLPGHSFGQAWSGVLASSRAIDWSTAGAGTIPIGRTQCGATIAAYTGTAATINNAIAACGANQFVLLGAGTFTLSTGISISNKSNITLRGNGPNSTFLVINAADGCGGIQGAVCLIAGSPTFVDSPSNTKTWSAGYTRGSTTITLSDKTNLQVGTLLWLWQLNDVGDADPGTDVFICRGTPNCTQSGSFASARDQHQIVEVTSVPAGACAPSCSIGITPGLYMPNWRSAKSPQAFHSSVLPSSGIGVENLSVDHNQGGINCLTMFGVVRSWVKNVRLMNCTQHGVKLAGTHHNTIRDSYIFNAGDHGNESYAVNFYNAMDNLVENNIAQYTTSPWLFERGHGNVVAYNFSINDCFGTCPNSANWMQASSYTHSEHDDFNLFESNDGLGAIHENYYGFALFQTHLRNRYAGWEPQPGTLANQTTPIHNYARTRFNNYIGNVVGTNTIHTVYEKYALSGTTSTSGSCNGTLSNTSPNFTIGLGSNCGDGGSGPFPTNDTNTRPSLMRWGNCDMANGTNNCRFIAGEVPSGIPTYANPVPASQTIPASFYTSCATTGAWRRVNSTDTPCPAIGPDVTGGDVTGSGVSVNAGLNGRVYKIPARRCYEEVMGGTFANSTTAKTFNATTCYSAASGSDTTPPAPPTGVTVTKLEP